MQADNDAENETGTPEPSGGPDPDTHQDADRRLIIILSIIAAVTAIGVGVLLRELYYGAYPHLRPQPAVSAGSVETCDHACTQRRLNEAEQRLRELETPR